MSGIDLSRLALAVKTRHAGTQAPRPCGLEREQSHSGPGRRSRFDRGSTRRTGCGTLASRRCAEEFKAAHHPHGEFCSKRWQVEHGQHAFIGSSGDGSADSGNGDRLGPRCFDGGEVYRLRHRHECPGANNRTGHRESALADSRGHLKALHPDLRRIRCATERRHAQSAHTTPLRAQAAGTSGRPEQGCMVVQ